jgi:hypothetical protein
MEIMKADHGSEKLEIGGKDSHLAKNKNYVLLSKLI